MLLKRFIVAAAAMSLVAAPTVGYAAQASVERASVQTEGESDLANSRRGPGIIIALLAAAAVIAGIIIAAKGDKDPAVSP